MDKLKADMDEVRADVKDLKVGQHRIELELAALRAVMPSPAKVRELELEMIRLNTQFKIVWATMAVLMLTVGGAVLSRLIVAVGIG